MFFISLHSYAIKTCFRFYFYIYYNSSIFYLKNSRKLIFLFNFFVTLLYQHSSFLSVFNKHFWKKRFLLKKKEKFREIQYQLLTVDGEYLEDIFIHLKNESKISIFGMYTFIRISCTSLVELIWVANFTFLKSCLLVLSLISLNADGQSIDQYSKYCFEIIF